MTLNLSSNGWNKRIVFKRIYLGRATLLGLYYGIITGIISAFLVFFATYFLIETIVQSGLLSDFSNEVSSSGFSGAAVLALVYFVVHAILTPILFFIGALIYNLASKMGGAIHFDLAEYEVVQNPGNINSLQNWILILKKEFFALNF